MTNDLHLQALTELCRRAGEDLYQVQAAGGNASVKIDGTDLLIKASGVRMAEVSPSAGWTQMRYDDLAARFEELERGGLSDVRKEMEYARILGTTGKKPGVRPSMEAGFHSILPERFVLHVHSLAGIVLGLLPPEELRRKVAEALGPQVRAIPIGASVPGFELTLRVMESKPQKTAAGIVLYLVAHHGLIWSSDDREALESAVRRFEEFFGREFGVKDYPPFHLRGSAGCRSREAVEDRETSRVVCRCLWPESATAGPLPLGPSFPDFIMYFHFWTGGRDLEELDGQAFRISGSSRRELDDKEQVLFAHAVICAAAERRGSLAFLPQAMVGTIKNLEAEKLRFAQMKKQTS